MTVINLHDKAEIEAFLRRNVYLHLYEIGDLDDFFWKHTTWYALKTAGEFEQLALVYSGSSLPILLAFPDGGPDRTRDLLTELLPLLPRRLYSHLQNDTVSALAPQYQIDSHGLHYKMALQNPARLNEIDTSRVIPLGTADYADLDALYKASYPGNWFDPRMLETGCYYGIRDGSALVSVAGIHVYSSHYRVATLGNVTTHPNHRGRGLGTAVCAKLCQSLLQTVDHIGLNVMCDNTTAISTYRSLGFDPIAEYEEFMLELK